MFEVTPRLGRYELREVVGKGATSQVWKAWDPFEQCDVAVKVFEEPADQTNHGLTMQRRGFLAEASLVGKLNHPHIVDILDAGSNPGYSYVVMEFVPGGSLEKHTSVQTLLSVAKVVEISFKCIRALAYAMQNGVIHRDIKPGNIMLSQAGDIKLTDFGAAIQRKTNETTITVDRGIEQDRVGSPAYMSPEQVKNETLTHQTDIYSLGVVMYHMLTGKLPFHATNAMGLQYAILNADPPPPSTRRPNLPAVLDQIVLKAMAKDRDKRYQSWIEFGKDLATAFDALRSEGEEATDSEQFEALRALPFFGGFDDVKLWEIVRIATWNEAVKGDVLIEEGDEGDGLFILVDGEVEVSLRGAKINSIKRGGIFGEMLYFADQTSKRSTTISAKTDCIVIEIKAKSISAATDGVQAEFNKACIGVLIERLSQMNGRLALLKAADR
jgi:eukaryotic-like serine/threonine-protein kinase